MTKAELAEELKKICLNKIEMTKNNQIQKDVKVYEAILKVLGDPDVLSKDNIELTLNILNDLEIDDDLSFDIVDEIFKQDAKK